MAQVPWSSRGRSRFCSELIFRQSGPGRRRSRGTPLRGNGPRIYFPAGHAKSTHPPSCEPGEGGNEPGGREVATSARHETVGKTRKGRENKG